MQTTVNAFRLSPQQNELWLKQPGDPACCVHAEILLEGQLNAPDLKKAIQQVINRHEILRTTFHRQPGLRVPFQVISDNPPAPIWDELDFSNLPLAQHDALVEEARAAEQAQSFDLEHGPLLRARLLRLSASARLLLLSLPALITDAKSLSNLIEEISRCYASARQNDDLDEPVQYIQFSEWQNELLEGEEAAEGKEYWHNQNLSTLSHSTLPFASRHQAAAFIARRHAVSLPSSLHAQLRAVVQAQAVSEEEFLLTCWLLLLSRHTGSSLLLGVHSEGRDYQELQSAIGLYSRLLPVKVEASAGERFSLMLSRTAQALRDARQWQ